MADFKNYSTLYNLKPADNYTSTSIVESVRLRFGKLSNTTAAPQTVPQLFHKCCQRFPQSPALVYEAQINSTAGTWMTVTYAQYERNVERAALALMHVGLTANKCVCVLANNCPEWCYVKLGTLRAGGVVSGIYLSSSPEAVKHALETSSACICVVEDATQLAKVKAVSAELPLLRAIIQLQGNLEDDLATKAGYYHWTDLMSLRFDEQLKEELERREKEVVANQCALLVFTSGTTGFPKAVMLSHDSLTSNIKFVHATIGLSDAPGVTVSYLPLNHIAALLFELLLPFLNGDCVYFADSDALKNSLTRTLKIARPTRLFGVPRIYEKLQKQLMDAEENSVLWWRYVTAWAKRTTLDCYMSTSEGIKPNTTIKYMLASLTLQRFKTKIGLDRCEHLWAGGAALSVDVKKFFLSMDLPIADLFGASEAGGAMTLTQGYCHLNSSGRAVQGLSIKINNPNKDGLGEICLKGRCTMIGYLNEPEKTSETVDKAGWLHTGDVGRLYSDGCLLITGRIKEIIITAGGENIPPIQVENLIKAELSCISNALLVGDKRKYLIVLLTLKTNIDDKTGLPLDSLHPDTINWLQSLGLDYTCLSKALGTPAYTEDYDYKNLSAKPDQRILTAIDKALARANQNAQSRAQRVQKFALLPHDFTVRTGELGPTLKFRRSFICEKYAEVIDQLYREDK